MLRRLPAQMTDEGVGKRTVDQHLCKKNGGEVDQVETCERQPDDPTDDQCDGQKRDGQIVRFGHSTEGITDSPQMLRIVRRQRCCAAVRRARGTAAAEITTTATFEVW